ncbi:hypothetical protein ACJJIK_04585 [Microbulbifer sp. ZKSA006]|uniref:hypothetical protein n=1 Tax=Microbulbifer sp. ZKSA006 TaxID=3243390 RepID=UPI0040398476
MTFDEFEKNLEKSDTRLFDVESFQEEMNAAANTLSPAEWIRLSETWESKSEQWQINFILSAEYVCKSAEEIIVQMLGATNREVVLAAINSLYDAGCGKWVPNQTDLIVLNELLNTRYYSYHSEEELKSLINRGQKL